MLYEWDERKAAANLAKHGVDFDAVHGFDWGTAVEFEDDRFRYDELRWVAIGWIGDTLHTLTFTWRDDIVRVISLRRSDKRDRNDYAKAKSQT